MLNQSSMLLMKVVYQINKQSLPPAVALSCYQQDAGTIMLLPKALVQQYIQAFEQSESSFIDTKILTSFIACFIVR